MPGAERSDLRVLADAAEDHGGAHRQRRCERGDDLGDLVGELAGRDEDQRAGAARLAPAARLREGDDGRDREGDGLAAAGLAAAEHVAAGERVGQRCASGSGTAT